MPVLVTGAAGFIGYHVTRTLLSRGEQVIGLDSVNDYYDVALKKSRLAELQSGAGDFRFIQCDISDASALTAAVEDLELPRVVHLAAQAGVRYSLENPAAYAAANLVGHLNMLELARHCAVRHMVYASSSSVYGGNTELPFRVEDRTDRPISLYAATKRADELMSESYAHLFRIPLTGLRFFTVYGPWGRPDMAMWIFTKAITEGQPIKLFNHGQMRRDFTYIEDIVEGIVACLYSPPDDDGQEKAGGSISPHAVYNIGNSRSEELIRLVRLIEREVGREAFIDLQPMQAGDVTDTYADIAAIERDHGFAPKVSLDEGVPLFVDWYRKYQKLG